jgi:hypothetical protein
MMTPEHIEKFESKVVCLVAEIIKTYAWKCKVSAMPSINKDNPLVTSSILHEPMNFSLEGELAKIKIPIPIKDLICMPSQREALSRFVSSGIVTNIYDENP